MSGNVEGAGQGCVSSETEGKQRRASQGAIDQPSYRDDIHCGPPGGLRLVLGRYDFSVQVPHRTDHLKHVSVGFHRWHLEWLRRRCVWIKVIEGWTRLLFGEGTEYI